MQRVYTVWAKWDDDADVWYVEQSDIPGLATEAPTADELVKNIRALAVDLIELNTTNHDDLAPIQLLWSGQQSLNLSSC